MRKMIVVIGGGAAGIFAAIHAKKSSPTSTVIVLEKSKALLSKVRVSGGGRCNVTHSCFDPKELVKNYPRGHKELLGPFHTFGPQDTITWFESRGVKLKTEKDGRIFPVTDSSETIIHCLLKEAKEIGVDIRTLQKVGSISYADHKFTLGSLVCDDLILCTGSSPDGLEFAKTLGHTIQKPVPSLFTFNVPTSPLKELSGITVDTVQASLPGTPWAQKGALLITHFGFSGPAILKLSAFAARDLFERNYKTPFSINWTGGLPLPKIAHTLQELKTKKPSQLLSTENTFYLPKNLWLTLLGPLSQKKLADISLKELQALAEKLHDDRYLIEGKTTHKEEFVTCGGITLKEVNFKTMESRLCPGLRFAGEILDIDGVTGGFNFQNAWTTGYLAGLSLHV
jgi:hypothetical protein